jgi:hypothetical protein
MGIPTGVDGSPIVRPRSLSPTTPTSCGIDESYISNAGLSTPKEDEARGRAGEVGAKRGDVDVGANGACSFSEDLLACGLTVEELEELQELGLLHCCS